MSQARELGLLWPLCPTHGYCSNLFSGLKRRREGKREVGENELHLFISPLNANSSVSRGRISMYFTRLICC